ncbi:peptide-methionine (S)-S-oxide reductase MsrA [Marinospirillum alkaliphilum]|uniref:Peptide methionine sulfoxide reductase MsrA n=1 Tax=Marinospirillum alkaliphilum DSM 21637 TaxID=1122209 RepID=A0A1K1UGS4_9GAMM|nr:peptide-methionine (S)-S-oxide reductase MsrA [Marinospirillum alkaliphilum]SFX11788.1 peptide-methionine (S)-S-oxide reductase [Marinospirillum alkaliphilum DSM 21637]
MTLFAEHHSGQRLVDPDAFPLPPELELMDGAYATRDVQRLVLGGGCFWCVEAVFKSLTGVLSVTSGYAGGSASDASYPLVCTGQTGHAEVVEICYDPALIRRGQLLRVFFSVAHNPTHLNHQGADHGPQYRSVVFYTSEAERRQVESYIHELNRLPAWSAPIVTFVEPLDAFYPAEQEHQNYAALHPGQPYIQAVALPKKQSVEQFFQALLNK